MAGSKILKEGEIVGRIRRAIEKAKNDSNCRDIYFKPQNITVGRFKTHKLCNRCIYVTKLWWDCQLTSWMLLCLSQRKFCQK